MHTQQQTLWEWAALRPSQAPQSATIRRKPTPRAPTGKLSLDALGPATEVLMEQWRLQAYALQLALTKALGVTVHLTLTKNRRRMITTRRDAQGYHLRLHCLFLGCEDEIMRALASFISGQTSARGALQDYIARHREAAPSARVAQEHLRAKGRYHDLSALLEEVLEELSEFEPAPIQITWGRYGKGRRSIRLGSYDFEQRLIRIHPALDQAWVPAYFVEYVIFHEVLHAIFPPEHHQGRRDIHTRAFCKMERTFYRYDEAQAWERAHLARLLEQPVA